MNTNLFFFGFRCIKSVRIECLVNFMPWVKFHNTLIRIRFNPIYFMQTYTNFEQFYQDRNIECRVYL